MSDDTRDAEPSADDGLITIEPAASREQTNAAAAGGPPQQRPAPPAASTVDAAAIAAAFAALAPTLLAPLRADLQKIGDENAALRRELEAFKAGNRVPAGAAVEPEVETYYVPTDGTGANPHYAKPPASSDKPQLYDLRGDVTNDNLSTAKGAHWYEFQTLACVCFFLKNILLHLEACLPRIIKRVELSATTAASRDDPHTRTGAEDAEELHGTYSSIKGVYDELANKRLQFLQLRAMLTDEQGRIPEEKRGLLEVFTNEIYGSMRDTLPTNLDDAYKKCISSWETSTRYALTKNAASATAKSRATTPAAAAGTSGKATLGTTRKRTQRGGGGGRGGGRGGKRGGRD